MTRSVVVVLKNGEIWSATADFSMRVNLWQHLRNQFPGQIKSYSKEEVLDYKGPVDVVTTSRVM